MRKLSGLTLVEVLVATVLVAVGVVALVGALRGFTKAEIAVNDRELASRLAHDKLDEVVATEDYLNSSSGSFSDPNAEGYTWRAEEIETGTQGLTDVRVTVTTPHIGDVTADTLVFRQSEAQQNTTNAGGTTQ